MFSPIKWLSPRCDSAIAAATSFNHLQQSETQVECSVCFQNFVVVDINGESLDYSTADKSEDSHPGSIGADTKCISHLFPLSPSVVTEHIQDLLILFVQHIFIVYLLHRITSLVTDVCDSIDGLKVIPLSGSLFKVGLIHTVLRDLGSVLQ